MLHDGNDEARLLLVILGMPTREKRVFIQFSKPHLDRAISLKPGDGRMPADWKALPLPVSRGHLQVFIEFYQ